MRISDWSSDVCSSDLFLPAIHARRRSLVEQQIVVHRQPDRIEAPAPHRIHIGPGDVVIEPGAIESGGAVGAAQIDDVLTNNVPLHLLQIAPPQHIAFLEHTEARKSVVYGTSVSLRVISGVRRNINNKTNKRTT